MPTWLAIFLGVDVALCALTVFLGWKADRRRRRREARELDYLGREFPISIHDRRSPLHPIGTPPVERDSPKAGQR